MKVWKFLLLIVVLLGLVGVAACATGIPQEQYDKAKADISAAQAQVQKLQNDLAQAQAQVKMLQADVTIGKEALDKTKSDLDKAGAQVKSLQSEVSANKEALDKTQGVLNAAIPYLRFLDMLLENQRQQIGIKPKYWQYSQEYAQAELVKAMEATNDPTLQALAERAFAQQGGGQEGWYMWLYSVAATTGILSGEGVPAAAIPRPPALIPSPTGETVIRVKLLQTDGKPIPNVEVDLWTEGAPPGSPNAGVARTDASGTASFPAAPGNYRADFNRSNFPASFLVPAGRNIQAQQGKVSEVEIRAFSR